MRYNNNLTRSDKKKLVIELLHRNKQTLFLKKGKTKKLFNYQLESYLKYFIKLNRYSLTFNLDFIF